MFSSKFVRWSGLAAIGAGMAILALYVATMVFEEVEGSGWEQLILALPLLWVVGLGGLALAGNVGKLGKSGLAFAGLACVVMLIGLLELFRVDSETGWTMMMIGMIGVPVGLIPYGLDGLKNKPLPRWNGLALAIGILAGPIAFGLEWIEELSGLSWQQQTDYGFILWALVMGLGWIGLGYLLWVGQPNQPVSLGEAIPIIVFIPLLLLLTACAGIGPQAEVKFTEPADGATVDAPFTAKMIAENFTLEPAGEVRDRAGHLHIMVNTDCVSPGNVIPKDATHLHYGNGQSEATLDLLPGQYKLCLQAADGAHIALSGDGMSDEINVTVANYSGPRVFFASPAAGAVVSSPVQVTMAAENFTIEPAGEIHESAGHLHIMVDTPCLPAGEVIPNDEAHLHYGNGQTEADIELTPGEHTLCLQAADGAHISLPGAGMTQVIELTVQ